MYHSITLGEKNTWDDWHLLPSSRPVVNPPNVKTQYVDIPGGNGVLDLTESLTGYPLYEQRIGSWEFYVKNGYQAWNVLYYEILNYLHGKRLKVILEDDPSYYYEGRLTVNEWKSDSWWSTIVIDYELYPYKKEISTSIEDWLWDPFNFETGVIREYRNLVVNGSIKIKIPTGEEYFCPHFNVDSYDGKGMNLIYKTKTYQLKDGDNLISDIYIGGQSIEEITFVGNGTVSIDYRGGYL